MFKKLLVFSLAFGLSLILLPVFKPKVETDLIEVTLNPTVSNTSLLVQTNIQNSINNISQFDDLVQKFKNAAAQNDRETVASLINFPVPIIFLSKKSSFHIKKIQNRDEFLKNYDEIFDDLSKQYIIQTKPDHISYNRGGEGFYYSSKVLQNCIFGIRLDRIYKNDNNIIEIKIMTLSKTKT